MKLPLALGLCALIAAGCAGPSETSSSMPPIPKPGKGIAEYREVAREAHKAVSRTVDSLEARDRTRTSTGQPAGFDKAFENLEVTSIKARARAEAIIARGQQYFDEWQEQLATNQPAAQAEYNRLFAHFTRVRDLSGNVRSEFRPFMASLRLFRASLDPLDPIKPADPPSAPPAAQPTPDVQTLTASGRRVLKTLESVSAALDDAEAELKTKFASKR
jgi:hypothetical protein